MNATSTDTSFSYLLIGSGRVARHLGHYFNLLNISFQSWDRSQDPHALARKVSPATHILLAISDSALQGFYRQHLAGHDDKVIVHFSGAHSYEGMIAAHPLMTFGPELYELSTYQKMYFTLTGADSLAEVLPGLNNKFSVIFSAEKARYHALCVLGGNFVTLLIAKMLEDFAEMKIPAEAAQVYLETVLKNTLAEPDRALTGPLVRKDVPTVNANLEALKNDPYHEIYQAFLKTYWPDFPKK
ncbi:MAG: DUF2520 domain-containing protein [Bdellovibrio sp.]|nr:DUF2520 domain-containing protein [Bdellovibrio sp.]